jgi:hypothetical protein
MTIAAVLTCSADRPLPAAGVELSADAALVSLSDGTGYLIDMAGKFYGLPPIAARMLALSIERGPQAAAAATAAEHGAPPAQVRADLDRFLADLADRGILARRRGRRRAASLGAALMAAGLSLAFKLRRSLGGRAQAALTVSRLSLAWFGWTATLEAWRRALPAGQAAADPELAAVIDTTVRERATRHWLGADCKERGLASWALARRAGLAPILNIGVYPFPLAGHCWCAVDGAVTGDDPIYAARFTPVLRYR